jgi:hypothetical protein
MVVRGKQVIVVLLLALGVGLFGFASLRAQATAGNTAAPAAVRPFVAPPALPSDGFQFAVIGDYGSNTINEERVADLVAGWQPAFVVTTGDNNYDNGAATTIDRNIGQYYSPFIGNYQGQYGDGSPTNRFWPSLGNHDWRALSCDGDTCTGPYFDYFTLPGNERYYDVDMGLIRLFVVDSDDAEPDGISCRLGPGRLAASRAGGLHRLLRRSRIPRQPLLHRHSSRLQPAYALAFRCLGGRRGHEWARAQL